MKIKKLDKLLQNLLCFQSINIILFFHLLHIVIMEDPINGIIIRTSHPNINNIIIVGDYTFRYLHFASFSNKSMIFETSSFPINNKRFFYGLKQNGRYYFKKSGTEEETPFNCLVADNEAEGKYESINYNLMIENKEYIISIGRLDSYSELYNFDINKIFSQKSTDLFGGISQYNMRPNLIKINEESNTFIFPIITKNNDTYQGYIFKFNLKVDFNSFSISDIHSYYTSKGFGEIASCFFLEDFKITISFFGYEENGKKGYCILAYNSNFSPVAKYFFTPTVIIENAYFYCIYFKENAGAFIYYYSDSEVSYPIIFFKKLNENKNSFTNYFSGPNNDIALNQYIPFYTTYTMNDLIKINDNKIGFFTASSSRKILFIIILNFYNENNEEYIKIRYYSIGIYDLFGITIWEDIKGYMFNDFIILATSYCSKEQCSSTDDNLKKYASTLMMIGYPYRDDYELNIINYLISDGNITIDSLIFDLAENMTIDNNVFGYIYNGTKIIHIENDDHIYLVSSISNNTIKENDILDKDEKIKIEFKNNLYKKSNYKLEYSLIVTEPEYDEFINYYVHTYPEEENITDREIFNSQRQQYIGKSIYYKVILEENLSIKCGDPECALCFENNKTCITYAQYIEIVTESEYPQTSSIEIQTEKSTETIIQDISEIKTDLIDNKTEKSTEPIKEDKSEIKTDLIDNKTEFNTCSQDEIINNECKNGRINDEQIKKIYDNLQSEITSNKTNLIIKTENVLFQLLSLEGNYDQIEIDDEISSIDLGECLNILKGITNDTLKMLKVDYKSEDLTSTFVQYEVYSISGDKMNLNVCSDVTIKINVPKILDGKTLSIFTTLENTGYNYTNKNDSFYNDICSTYTSEAGKDVLLSDRYNDIYTPINNMYICQSDCQFISYNTSEKKAECDCKVQQEKTITSLKDVSFNKDKIFDAFIGVLKNSNFLVLKCYKLLLDFSKLLLNYGFIIMSIILILNIILMIIFCIIGKKKISELIKYFIKNKFEALKDNKKNRNSKASNNNIIIVKKKTNKSKINIKKIVNNIENNIKNEGNNKSLKDLISNKGKNIRKRKRAHSLMIKNNKNLNKDRINKRRNTLKIKNNFPPKKKDKNSQIFINNNVYNINLQKSDKTINKDLPSRKDKRSSTNFLRKSVNSSTNIKRKSQKSSTNIKRKSLRSSTTKRVINASRNQYNLDFSKSKFSNSERVELERKSQDLNEIPTQEKKIVLNDQEMDMLDYKKALEIDKRTYFQYYFSLLKRKQLILFAFYPNNDYNLIPLKISLFLLAFSLYFTMNGFFFSDETMHEIYEDNSSFNILIQIPIIIYSSCVTSVINIILRQLSLSENNILSIKKEKEYMLAVKKSKSILRCLIIKFFFYFLLSLLVLLFCWYFISCFGAVYSNTQIILISDSFLSFGLSMLYPFGLNLLPLFFRIPALRAKKKDKECLYKFSKIIALI